MPFGFPDHFSVEKPIVNQWAPIPDGWQHDEAKKKAFGAALTRHSKPFDAALTIFADTGQALWASQFWLTDPIVIAEKNAHNAQDQGKFLDKDGLAARLLKFAEEKDPSQRFYVVEAKDRLAAYKLYAEIQGFIGNRIDINASTNTINNVMQIKFVKPNKEEKVIEPLPEEQVEETKLQIPLKLVSAR